MPRFDYVRAHSVDEALALLGNPALVSRPLAGGTDVMVFVRHEKPPFDRVVDITRVPELKLYRTPGRRDLHRRGRYFHGSHRERVAPRGGGLSDGGGVTGRRAGHPQRRDGGRQRSERRGVRRHAACAGLPGCGRSSALPGGRALDAAQHLPAGAPTAPRSSRASF